MGRAKGRAEQGTLWKETTNHTQRWETVYPKLRRVQEKARASKNEQFTSLAHHLTVSMLKLGYDRLELNASAGVDGITKRLYRKNLTRNLQDLHERLKTMKYRASPVKRVWIEKPGGGERPLGLPTVEDKIVQGAVVEILNCIYEEDFLGFSYGFRPRRNPHQALQALQTVLQKGRVNWVLDADLSKFFDTIDHKELMTVIQHRVKDWNIIRLIGKWLSAGIVEPDGRRVRMKAGTPQGGVISPLLANIFLHHVLDQYVHEWRQTKAKGELYIIRYADDFVICSEYEEDIQTLLSDLSARFDTYKLKLNQEKTRLIRFGKRWKGPGGPKSGTFDFLGFTHIAGKDRQGRYLVQRKTARKRFCRSVKTIRDWCCRNRHKPVRSQWQDLCLKLIGHYEYYGVRGNYKSLSRLRQRVWGNWLQALKRRSQKLNRSRLHRLTTCIFKLPPPQIIHSEGWLPMNPVYLLGRAGCGNSARPVL